MEPENNTESEFLRNYGELKSILESGLQKAATSENLFEAKGCLIEVQNHFRGLKLRREDREELYNRLQEAFSGINGKIAEERFRFDMETAANFDELVPELETALEKANSGGDSREAWGALLNVQDRIRVARLSRDHRDILHHRLQEAFDTIKKRRESDQQSFEQQSRENYSRLKTLVEKGLRQAEETHEYKETREFLKKIQSEFKGVKMNHDQREELYSRLQTAFDILSKRLDDYFRNKKKNWEVRMTYTLSRLAEDIHKLRESIRKDEEMLVELRDQLEIVESSGRESAARLSLQSRIASVQRETDRKKEQVTDLEMEQDTLKIKLAEPPSL